MWMEGFNCLSWLPELFCKRLVYILHHESNSGVDGRRLPSHITHSINSSHLHLESLSRHVMVLQRMQSITEHWLCTGRHLSCMSALPSLMSLLSVHALSALPVVIAVTCSLKSTVQSRAVRTWTTKIVFDPAANSIWIQYWNQFESYM